MGGYFLFPAPTPTSTVIPKEAEKPTEVPLTIQAPTSGVTEISVSGTEFSFSPAGINAKAGERVKITFRNIGQAPHNLVLEGLGVTTKTIGKGQTDVIEFTAPSSGIYNFFCSVSGHRTAGMEGKLEVE